MKILLYIAIGVRLAAAATHSLQYFYTAVTPGKEFPEFTVVGQVDGQQFDYYDSNIKRTIPKTEWIEKNEGDDYWSGQSQILQNEQENYKVNVAILMQRFNQTKGVHTVQRMYGCELNDDGSTRGYEQWGYDGEDFVTFDLKTLTWTAPTPEAVITKNKWDPDTGYNNNRKNYLEKECIDWINKYLTYGKETLERKVRPEALVFQEEATSPEVVCHATGFFPKLVMITWQKDGQDVIENVELRETLLNQDGSFQRRSILKVPAEELNKYTCVVQHSSLEKDMVLNVSERQILGGGAPIAIIIGVIIALLVLAAVVAGVVIYKKKNSGFKPVPPKPSSEGDSSSNNS